MLQCYWKMTRGWWLVIVAGDCYCYKSSSMSWNIWNVNGGKDTINQVLQQTLERLYPSAWFHSNLGWYFIPWCFHCQSGTFIHMWHDQEEWVGCRRCCFWEIGKNSVQIPLFYDVFKHWQILHNSKLTRYPIVMGFGSKWSICGVGGTP